MNRSSTKAIRKEAYEALARIFSQLAIFAVVSGLSITQLERILRTSAVRSISSSQQSNFRRSNISRISALTGLSRAAVSYILKSKTRSELTTQRKEQYTNRVLSAWHRDPKFIDRDGSPKVLPIFGRAATFEVLCRKYGSGVPVRAILDELTRMSAVELVKNQRVRAKSLIAVNQGIDKDTVRALGIKIEDFLRSLLHNIQIDSNRRFVASAESLSIPPNKLAFLRREIEKRGSTLVSEIEESILTASADERQANKSKDNHLCRAGIAVFYFEDSKQLDGSQISPRPRKNLRRK